MSIRSLFTLTVLLVGSACKNNEDPQMAENAPAENAPSDEATQQAPPESSQQWPSQQSIQQPTPQPTQQPGQQTPPQPLSGDTTTQAPSAAAMTMSQVDCSQTTGTRKGWTVSAPEGATCTETGGTVVVSAGEGFQLTIREGKPGMAVRKKAIESDTVNRFRRYATDTTDAIVYETDSGTGMSGYQVYATTKVGDTAVVCESQKGKTYTQAQAEAMVKACQSLTKK